MARWAAIAAFAAMSIPEALAQSTTTIGGLSGSHTDIPRWCGKPYEAGSPNFDPGGQIEPPAAAATPTPHVSLQPRHSIYDSSEDTGSFLVDIASPPSYGRTLQQASSQWPSGPWQPQDGVEVEIQVVDTHRVLACSRVEPNSTNHEIAFSFAGLQPSLEPYKVQLSASLWHGRGGQNLTASTDLYYLPAKNTGSTVKIDNLNGGMLVANNVTKYAFEPFLPFGFYTSCSGYLNYSLANVSAYKDLGFNAINPVCAYTDGDLDFLFDWLDETNLWYQYDMRSNYQNLTEVAEQVSLLKDRPNLLSWYTADEPDGWEYALNSTKITYDLLKEEDPYHPTGLVLNCQDYYFEEYTAGTDYIMQDAYPVGIDPTYSRKFNTTVNATYGDCGCDNCIGSLKDVSDRLDDFTQYQQWLGGVKKPLWSVLQAFSGEQYWSRDPTPEETWVMMIISFNHQAKGMMSWTFPPSDILANAHGEMSKVITQPEVSKFLLGGLPTLIKVEDQPALDAAYWTDGDTVLVAIANTGNTSISGPISLDLPATAKKISSQPWGSLSWSIENNGKLSIATLPGLATSILLLTC